MNFENYDVSSDDDGSMIDFNQLMLDGINAFDAFDLEDLLESLQGSLVHEEVLPFPHGDKKTGECVVCLEHTEEYSRPCCSALVCASCITTFCETTIQNGLVKIPCPTAACRAYIHMEEIIYRLPDESREKYHRYLTDANKDPHIKTCPRCCHITKIGDRGQQLKHHKTKKYGLPLVCSECNLEWCFPCQAPWHKGLTCKQYRTGDKLVKHWADKFHLGARKAQKCPRCKVFIERTEGCDHMQCSKCKTQFCYRCGERFRSLKFVGNHYSRYSVLGCKYHLKPDKPAQRKFIRGAILGGKILAVPCIAALAVGAGAVLLVAGAVAGPFYGGYKLHQARLRMKRLKQFRKQNVGRVCMKRSMNFEPPRPIGVGLYQKRRSDPEVSLRHVRETHAELHNLSSSNYKEFDENDYDLEFYDCVFRKDLLDMVKMTVQDLPLHHPTAIHTFSDNISCDTRSCDSGLDYFQMEELEPDTAEDSSKKRNTRVMKNPVWQPSCSESSDSDIEELDSGTMFLVDSAGNFYSADHTSIRASKTNLVEYVAAVSETTYL